MSTTPKGSVWPVRLANIDLVLPVCADDGPPRKTREPRKIGVTKRFGTCFPPRYDRPVIFSSEPRLPVEPGFQHNGPCRLETRRRAGNVLNQQPQEQSKRTFGSCHSSLRLPVPRKHLRHRRVLMQVLQRYSQPPHQIRLYTFFKAPSRSLVANCVSACVVLETYSPPSHSLNIRGFPVGGTAKRRPI